MLPLAIHNDPSSIEHSIKHYFYVNKILIGLCVAVYIIEMRYADQILSILKIFGVSSSCVIFSGLSTNLLSFFTYNFLHGNILHLLINCWVLFVIGNNVERHIGSFKYILLFFGGGLFSGIVVSMLGLSSHGVYVGASAAVSAVLGVFIVNNYNSRMFVMIPILVIPYFIEVYSYIFISFWIIFQVFFGLLKSFDAGLVVPNTEYWSHLAGFIFGLIFCSKSLFARISISFKKNLPA